MKKHLLTFLILFTAFGLAAQKKGLNYQAVVMDPKPVQIPGGEIVGQPYKNGNLQVRFTLLSNKNEVDYEEIHDTKTDDFGLVNLTIGNGTSGALSGNGTKQTYRTFDAVQWTSELKQLKVEISYDKGNNYNVVSVQPFNYMAYALYADAVEYMNVRNSPTTLSFFNNDVGYIVDNDLNPLRSTVDQNQKDNISKFLIINQNLADNKQTIDDNTKKLSDISVSVTNQGNQLSNQGSQIQSIDNTQKTIVSQVSTLNNQVASNTQQLAVVSNSYENVGNKSNNIQSDRLSTDKYPSVKAMKDYVDQATLGIALQATVDGKEDKNNKSTNISADKNSNDKYPTVKAIKDYVDVATNGVALQATVDAKEEKSNKSTNVQADKNSDVKYPTVKAIKDYVDNAALGKDVMAVINGKEDVQYKTNDMTVNNENYYPTVKSVRSYVDNVSKNIVQLDKDLGGTPTLPIVTGLQGNPISTEKPKAGEIMKYINGVWTPSTYDAVTNEQQTLKITGKSLTITGTNSTIDLPEATTTSLGIVQLA
ncbi:MAG: hypothetical protein RI995_470, partial [Bacteroidota bacterium]